MASKKVSDQVLLFEAANFKGTPKQFGYLADKIKESFPNSDFSSHAGKMSLTRNHTGYIALKSPVYMGSTNNTEY